MMMVSFYLARVNRLYCLISTIFLIGNIVTVLTYFFEVSTPPHLFQTGLGAVKQVGQQLSARCVSIGYSTGAMSRRSRRLLFIDRCWMGAANSCRGRSASRAPSNLGAASGSVRS